MRKEIEKNGWHVFTCQPVCLTNLLVCLLFCYQSVNYVLANGPWLQLNAIVGVCVYVWACICFFCSFFGPSLCVYVCVHACVCACACACVYDEVSGSELIGHMSAQMSSLFNKAGELNCHYCQHLTVVLPARWYLVIYHNDELSQITLYWLHDESIPD